MLNALSIRNIVLIDRLDLEFSGGLTALTGETGAGKSILLDALGLALGARADFGLIRAGEDRASVTAHFTPPEGSRIFELLDDAGISPEPDLYLKRQLRSDGKSPATINDEPVSVQLLRQIGDLLLEIQGQFEGRGLLDQTSYLPLIDRACQHDDAVSDLSDAWSDWAQARRALQTRQAEVEKSRAEEDWLRDALRQLDELAPQTDEEDSLLEQRGLHANAARLAEALSESYELLAGETGAEPHTGRAERIIERQLDIASSQLTPVYETVQRAQLELAEAASQIKSIAEQLDGDPAQLTRIDDRLHELRAQARKHSTEVNQLPELHEELRNRLMAVDDSASELAELSRAEEQAEARFRSCADLVSSQRRATAAALDSHIMAELPPLKLEAATFSTAVSQLDEPKWSRAGWDKVSFEAATNPGMTPGPIDKIASGGELARFLLAMKVVLAANEPPKTLIFDEVDSGVGGAVAAAVGNRLNRLGKTMQTLVITHSPQVAAAAQSHFHISKSAVDGGTISQTRELSEAERIDEIARMLSGQEVTEQARAAATSLLDAYKG